MQMAQDCTCSNQRRWHQLTVLVDAKAREQLSQGRQLRLSGRGVAMAQRRLGILAAMPQEVEKLKGALAIKEKKEESDLLNYVRSLGKCKFN